MTAPRDPDQLIRAFLDEGRTELPDRAYDAVRGQIDRTRQRAVIGPWRESDMNTYAKLALAAAAVLVVAVIGINLLPGGRGGVGGSPAASPTPILPTASPAPTPRTLTTSDVGSTLAAGTYRVAAPFVEPFTVTVPGNQFDQLVEAGVAFDNPASNAGYAVLVPNGTYADPCAPGATPQPAPATVDGLVQAFASMKGFRLDSSVDVTFDGHAGKAIVLTNTLAADAACPFDGWVPIFDYAGAPPEGAATNRGVTEYFWIVDVAGTPVIIAPSTNARTFGELDPLIQSIHFDH